MKKIIFIRTAPYDYKFPDKSLYESLDDIGLQKSQPHILKPSIKTEKKIRYILKNYKPSQIFCSKLIRSQETAKLFSKKISMLSNLNEIKFSMNNFSSKEEFPTDNFDYKKINGVRYDFSQMLINNRLQEKKENIIKRIINFGEILKNNPDNQNIFCFSHGFIMKLFENYFISGKKDIDSLISAYNWKKPTFDFTEGFALYCENSVIKIKKV